MLAKRPMIGRGFVLTVLLLSTLVGAGCSVNSMTGRPQLVLVSKEKERQIGSEEARKVEETIGHAGSAELSSYLRTIGDRLVEQLPEKDFDYSFVIVDMEEPNAFALPGGYVFVSRGLLALVNSEDELANVLGHEVGHVVARHAGQRMTAAAPFSIATGLGAMATGIVSPMLGRAVAGIGQATSGLVLSPYSRDQEREADRLGMELAARAGWDPSAMSRFLHTLEREEDLRAGSTRQYSFLSSHPSMPERVAKTAAEAEKMAAPRSSVAPDRATFLQHLVGLIVGSDPAAGLFEDSSFLQPRLGFALRFPLGWQTHNETASVAAAPKGGEALCLLQLVANGDDPSEAAKAAAQALGFDVADIERLRIAGLAAARVETLARTSQGTVAVQFTWIAHRGRVYQVSGLTSPSRIDQYRPIFTQVSGSFRTMNKTEIASIEEVRLRVKEARSGETVADVVQRTGARWTADETAVANDLQKGKRFGEAALVKVPLAQAYSSRD